MASKSTSLFWTLPVIESFDTRIEPSVIDMISIYVKLKPCDFFWQ